MERPSIDYKDPCPNNVRVGKSACLISVSLSTDWEQECSLPVSQADMNQTCAKRESACGSTMSKLITTITSSKRVSGQVCKYKGS